jgi:hypothetical protein
MDPIAVYSAERFHLSAFYLWDLLSRDRLVEDIGVNQKDPNCLKELETTRAWSCWRRSLIATMNHMNLNISENVARLLWNVRTRKYLC